MDKNIRKVFSEIELEIQYLDTRMCNILADYKIGKEKAKAYAADYKDEVTVLNRELGGLKQTARSEIDKAERDFAQAMNEKYLPKLRTALTEYVTAAPPVELMQTLSFYKQFGIEMSRAELDSLIHGAAGNYFALRAIQNVAKDHHFKVSFAGADDYQKDLQRLERLTFLPICYAPEEYMHEAIEVMDKRPVFRNDGSVVYMTANDTFFELLQSGEYRNVQKNLGGMGERWGCSIVPEISTLKDKQNATAEEQYADALDDAAAAVSVKGTEDTDIAAAIGKRNAEERKKSEEIIQHYAKH